MLFIREEGRNGVLIIRHKNIFMGKLNKHLEQNN